jgi:hypothetical protein
MPLHLLLITCALYADDPAAAAPSFTKQIKPFLAKYCMECHNQDDAESEFVVETYETFVQGGTRGALLVPGKPDESRLVNLLEGKAKPVMPPKKAAHKPTSDEIAMVRAWVAAGAKNDTGEVAELRATLPPIKPRTAARPKINAAAYSIDGKRLVVSAGKELVFLNAADGTYFGKVGFADAISSMALSRDGKQLAVATGAAGQVGHVHIMPMPGAIVAADLKPDRTFQAHSDLIHAMDFSADGKFVATCGYDKLVKLWNADSGAEVAALKDHSDSVYGVAFSPDSKLLATCSADRAVKIWEVVSGRRLYTLGEPTDWVYTVAWSPDGKYVAAGGVDKSIRVWEATAAEGRIVHSTFAHDAAIVKLVYSSDSHTLFSLSDDRTVKAWDTAQMIERQHFDKLPETPLALAVTADARQLAVGRFDGVVDFFDVASGKRPQDALAVAEAKPAPKPEKPVLAMVNVRGARRGQTLRLILDGKHLNHATELAISGSPAAAGLSATLVHDEETARNPNRAKADLTIPPETAPGVLRISLKSPVGNSAELPFAVTAFTEVFEPGADGPQEPAIRVSLPTTVVGSLDRAGDMDYYRFDVSAGQQLAVEVLTGAITSKLEPVLTLTDASGRTLAETIGLLMGHKFERAGSYELRIRDVDYRGSGEMFYRMNLGDMPLLTDVFPLGVARGNEIDVQVAGVNLGEITGVKVKAADGAEPSSRVHVSVPLGAGVPLNSKSLVVGEFPEIVESGANDELTGANVVASPVTVNGRIEKPGDVDLVKFSAKKGQQLIIDVNARRLGSPLDSFIEIFDTAGQPVPRATLRCLAKTYTVFRDHDSASPGIRIEDWRELAMNDYILIGNEVLRMSALPKNPDDDAQFFQLRGARVGYLDTTPAHVPLATPIYKVSINAPGTRFPPNGMPVVTIPFQNDDGGPQYGKDSRVFFDPPWDGEYLVRISDVRGQGSTSHAYRLAIRPPKPSYTVSFNPTAPSVGKGEATPIAITSERFDGFEGPIEIRLDQLAPGFSAPVTTIPPGENVTSLALYAEPGATSPEKDAPKLKLVAKAMIDGHELVREVAGGLPTVTEPGDVITTVDRNEVVVQPGREAKLLVRVERRNDFKGRIPIEVRGLPHGTRVLDIGLNGILITERETSRMITLYSEPWAQPTSHPFVVLAKREGKTTEHAAPSILLRIVPPSVAAAGSE